ncbi:MAG: helix-turn-helix transcriptional regulator [Haliscomenobacter sp.]|nr:helix-turn-helix transcriptional regulator [Haliscomenobacter sp.]
MDAQQIGEVIRRHRKASKLNRIECARLAGVGKTVVYDIEHGKASVQLDTLLKILKVFNISLSLSSPYLNATRPDHHTSEP